ncbi:MAG: hypothetical protein OSA45_14230 [Halioglobus sp.]|nr:hypothetical protein [Halioglobus sp.]
MLSLSADIAQQDVDLQIINGQGNDDILHGHELMQFAEAVARRDNTALQTSRNALLEAAGSQVLVDAAAVAGNFQRMVRIADATGIPVDGLMNALSGSITEELDLHRFASAQHTPQQNTLQKLVGVPVRFLLQRVVRAGKR